jgi:hypothetical protein
VAVTDGEEEKLEAAGGEWNQLKRYSNGIKNNAKIHISTLESYTSYGLGSYAMTSVKLMTGSENFLSLPDEKKGCRNRACQAGAEDRWGRSSRGSYLVVHLLVVGESAGPLPGVLRRLTRCLQLPDKETFSCPRVCAPRWAWPAWPAGPLPPAAGCPAEGSTLTPSIRRPATR